MPHFKEFDIKVGPPLFVLNRPFPTPIGNEGFKALQTRRIESELQKDIYAQ